MINDQLFSLFHKSKQDRHRFLTNHLDSNIAAQLYAMRDQREWTQKRVAEEAGVAQPRIPSYEDPNYGAYTLATLKKFAYAFDVALVVRFVPFSELADWIANLSPGDLAVHSFDKEQREIPASPMLENEARKQGSPIKDESPLQDGAAAELATMANGQLTSRLGLFDSKPTNVMIDDEIREPILK